MRKVTLLCLLFITMGCASTKVGNNIVVDEDSKITEVGHIRNEKEIENMTDYDIPIIVFGRAPERERDEIVKKQLSFEAAKTLAIKEAVAIVSGTIIDAERQLNKGEITEDIVTAKLTGMGISPILLEVNYLEGEHCLYYAKLKEETYEKMIKHYDAAIVKTANQVIAEKLPELRNNVQTEYQKYGLKIN